MKGLGFLKYFATSNPYTSTWRSSQGYIPTPPLLTPFAIHSVCEQCSLRFKEQEGRKVNLMRIDHVSSFDLVCGTILRVDHIKLCLLLWFEFFKTMDLLSSCPRDTFFHYAKIALRLNRIPSKNCRRWHFFPTVVYLGKHTPTGSLSVKRNSTVVHCI